jgi:hypothetical protein
MNLNFQDFIRTYLIHGTCEQVAVIFIAIDSITSTIEMDITYNGSVFATIHDLFKIIIINCCVRDGEQN